MLRLWILRRVLKSFRAVSRVSLWFETRFTPLGRLLCTGSVAAAIFGLDPNQTVALQLASLLFAALAIARRRFTDAATAAERELETRASLFADRRSDACVPPSDANPVER